MAVLKRIPLVVLLALAGLSGCAADRDHRVLDQLPSPLLSVGGPKLPANPSQPPLHPAYGYNPVPTGPFPGVTNVPIQWFPSQINRDWQAIVIHHSASDIGGAQAFDIAHRARGWDELGYHFVIGNGSDTPDGYVEVGSRWIKQKHGAHCKTPSNFYNEFGIGICLVGNYDETTPTPRQMQSLRRLVAFLAQRYHIQPNQIWGHGEVPGTHTHCPGRYFPMSQLRYEMSTVNTPVWASNSP